MTCVYDQNIYHFSFFASFQLIKIELVPCQLLRGANEPLKNDSLTASKFLQVFLEFENCKANLQNIFIISSEKIHIWLRMFHFLITLSMWDSACAVLCHILLSSSSFRIIFNPFQSSFFSLVLVKISLRVVFFEIEFSVLIHCHLESTFQVSLGPNLLCFSVYRK